MKIALRLPLGPLLPDLVEIAKRGEAAGCESVWCGDHLLWPTEIDSRYPYSETGKARLDVDTPFYDVFMLLNTIAGVTSRLRLATGVYILPLRPAMVTACAAATLDVSSGGRLIFGVGVGWMREEFAAVGVDFDQRGPLTDEYIDVLREVWGNAPASFHGRTLSFNDAYFEPRPVRGAAIPIHVGGETGPAFRRAAKLGDGWVSMSQSTEAAVEAIAKLKRLREEAGRGDKEFEVTSRIPWPCDHAALQEFAKAGVSRVIISPWDTHRESGGWKICIKEAEEFLGSLPGRKSGEEIDILAN